MFRARCTRPSAGRSISGWNSSRQRPSRRAAALAATFLASLKNGLRGIAFPGRRQHRRLIDARLNPVSQLAGGRCLAPAVVGFSCDFGHRLLLELVVESRNERGVPRVHPPVSEGILARLSEVGEHEPVARVSDGLADLLRYRLDIVAALLDELTVRFAFFEWVDVGALQIFDYLHLACLNIGKRLHVRGYVGQSRLDACSEPPVAGDDFVFAALDWSGEHGDDYALLFYARDELVEFRPIELLAARVSP
jgi:hypothetical protein